MTKIVKEQTEWDKVVAELDAEDIKLASYDNTLVPLLRNLQGKNVLDYGCGPGVLALALQKLGANVKGFDISEEMVKECSHKIGVKNTYNFVKDIPTDHFDFIICNLVMCIVPEDEVAVISQNIRNLLKKGGYAYIGFCNPKIFNVYESQLDFREKTGYKYEENHSFTKIKKEGNYRIVELHRPIEWYEREFKDSGLKLVETIFTPEYELNGNKIQDFVIFKLMKAGRDEIQREN